MKKSIAFSLLLTFRSPSEAFISPEAATGRWGGVETSTRHLLSPPIQSDESSRRFFLSQSTLSVRPLPRRKDNRATSPLDMSSTALFDLGDIITPSTPYVGSDDLDRGLDLDLRISEMRRKLMEISQKTELVSPQALSKQGLSKLHRRILEKTCGRQRFVTGRDPLFISAIENPTR